jgi:hypothetical protein
LNHGNKCYEAHEVENIIAMVDWLLRDDDLRFDDAGQRHRLVISMEAYRRSAPVVQADRKDTSIGELLSRMDGWIGMLTDREGMLGAAGRQSWTN